MLVVLAVSLAYVARLTDEIFDDGARDLSRVAGPDGRYELVTVRVAPFPTIDPYTEVRLRTGRGSLSRETVVWEGHEDGPGTRTVRFAGPRTVEVITDHGCEYRSAFVGWTLRLHPVHTDPPGRAC